MPFADVTIFLHDYQFKAMCECMPQECVRYETSYRYRIGWIYIHIYTYVCMYVYIYIDIDINLNM